MTAKTPETHVITEVRSRVGCITLNRPKALNALSLGMIRDITAALLAWRDDAQVVVARKVTGKIRKDTVSYLARATDHA